MPNSIHTQVKLDADHHRRMMRRGLITGLAAAILTAMPLTIVPSRLALIDHTADAHGGGGGGGGGG
ncbi:MAG TPA: hypothetical protein VNW90_16620, partial [Acetobacteraceae bacterium]|nr:hypothetical protein [Acetobacteraceae bacterium]